MNKRIVAGVVAGTMSLSAVPISAGVAVATQKPPAVVSGGEEETPETVNKMSDEQSTALTNNAIAIFGKLHEEKEDTLISPLSIQYAIAMLTDAAGKQTLQEISDFCGLSKEEMDMALGYVLGNQLIPETPDEDEMVPEYRNIFKITNSLWSNADSLPLNISESLREKLNEHYNADLFKAKLSSDEGITQLNEYIEDNTLGLISQMFDEPLNSEVVAVLLNTIGFECGWAEVFNEAVPDQEFINDDGVKSKVALMYSDDQKYVESDTATGVCLDFTPYSEEHSQRRYSMFAVMPKEGLLQDYLDNLSTEELTAITQVQEDKVAHVYFPKFDFDQNLSLTAALKELGIATAFTDASDINLTDNKYSRQKISDAIQKTKIEVAENGTKAAAVTALMMKTCGIVIDEREVKELSFNKPFFYMIWDNINNIPIFMGTCEQLNQ